MSCTFGLQVLFESGQLCVRLLIVGVVERFQLQTQRLLLLLATQTTFLVLSKCRISAGAQ